MYMSNSTTWGSRRQSSAAKTDRLRTAFRRGWTPPPRISVVEWADRYRRLAKEAGSNSGRWKTSTVEVARGPMLAVTEPGVHVISVMCCTQLMKTALLENIFGYFAHLDPCPMLLVQPKEDAAEQFSKERITPMVKATPVLREVVGTGKTRSAEETLLYKAFPGGFLALAGAGSPDNLARRPVRVVLYDEVDKYPITKEGDPITLGDERTATFGVNWLSVRACSPTVENESRIAESYYAGDQRRASVECPHCQHRQFPDFFKHVEWDKEFAPDGTILEHRPKTARLYCEACGVGWTEGERLKALSTIRWHQTRTFRCCGEQRKPMDAYKQAWQADAADPVGQVWDWWAGPRYAVYRAKCPDCGRWAVDNDHASFQAGKLYSPWTKDSPAHQAGKWLDAKDDEDKKQAWVNTQQGLPYKAHTRKSVAVNTLLERCEQYEAEVPEGVAVVTLGGDVQSGEGGRLEVEIVGWGRNEESWSLGYHVLPGDPDAPETWAQMDELLSTPLRRIDGSEAWIEAACIDSGGHNTQAVYDYCKARIGRRVWAIKGASERSAVRQPIWPTGSLKRQKAATFRPFLIGVNAAKDRISKALQVDQPGPNYCHFPVGREPEWFKQLTGEVLVADKTDPRRKIWTPKKGHRTEAWDCRVYNYAALKGLEFYGLHLNRRADQLEGKVPMAPPTPPPQKSSGGWISGGGLRSGGGRWI